MRAIVRQGAEQQSSRDVSSVGGVRRRRQVFVQEEEQLIMGNDECCVYPGSNSQSAVQSDNHGHEIVEYVYNSLATTELRLNNVLQEALTASQFQFGAATTAHTDQRANEIEGRLQEMLQVNHAELEEAATTAIEQRTASIGNQISTSLAQNNNFIRDRLFQLTSECDKHLQITREQCENIAATSAKISAEEQAAMIEERLELSLAEKHTLTMDSKLKEIATAISGDLTQNNECIRNQLTKLRCDCEEILQFTREQREKIAANSAKSSAEEQAAETRPMKP